MIELNRPAEKKKKNTRTSKVEDVSGITVASNSSATLNSQLTSHSFSLVQITVQEMGLGTVLSPLEDIFHIRYNLESNAKDRG